MAGLVGEMPGQDVELNAAVLYQQVRAFFKNVMSVTAVLLCTSSDHLFLAFLSAL